MSLGNEIAPHLAFLRRYARALTGHQSRGDALVKATLETIVADPAKFPATLDVRLGLYRVFNSVVNLGAEPESVHPTLVGREHMAQARLARITPLSRQTLLLTAMEGFTHEEAAILLDVLPANIPVLLDEALAEIDAQTRSDVLIIEDEPMIAMDLETIVRDLGHDVAAVAVTRDEAIAAVRQRRPGLVLADIQLADDSSGIDAVKDILAQFSVPVIFITAFPERLLTGERPEPTYLITKPFQRATVKAAIAQALFFDAATVPLE